MAVHKVKETLTLNRLAYVGMCILDPSKTLKYDFHYNYIKKKYNNRDRLLFTDKESLTYEIEAEDVYNDFWNDKDMFDNSDYQESSPYHCNVNKKSLESSRRKLVASQSLNSLVLSLRCILTSQITPQYWCYPPQYWCYPPACTDVIPPLYWTTSTVLKLSPHSTEAIPPQYWSYPPTVLKLSPHCTE